MTTLNEAWLEKLDACLRDGRRAAPRGKPILELDHATVAVDMERCVLTVPERKLNYRFAAAEAHWILSGSDRLDWLTPYNARMAEFSDDGETLRGAYGPRFVTQLPYVVRKLTEDRDTRQATMTFWERNPERSKDCPCTVAIDFKVRDEMINAHAFMRSSDLWLGLPYDAFSFTMMACRVAEVLNQEGFDVGLGTLWVTAASSHLYEDHHGVARVIAARYADDDPPVPGAVPAECYDPSGRNDGLSLIARLERLRDARRGDPARWWEP
jgi:thymidylate synthase